MITVRNPLGGWNNWVRRSSFSMTQSITMDGKRLRIGEMIGREWRHSRLDMFRSPGASEGRTWKDYQTSEMPWVRMKENVFGRKVGRSSGDINRWKGGRERLFPSMVSERHTEYVQTVRDDRITLGTRVPYADDISRGGRLPPEWGGGRRPARRLLTVGTGMVRRLRRVEAVIIAEHEQGWERATQGSRAPIAAGAK